MTDPIEIDHLRSWIGKQERESDTITPELVKRFRAALYGYTQLGTEPESPLPLGIHWCLARPAAPHAELGTDGHPAKGGFLPPVPLPRRMWASSRLRFYNPPGVGALIERTSTIKDVVLKQSAASGPLVFVQVDHAYAQDNEALIEDRQTIVYRQPSAFKRSDAQASKMQLKKTAITLDVIPDSTLLFRYSALTFNGHRIHYDHNYTTGEEGYPGLVVHGPLTATLLINLAQASRPGKPLREFEFRAVAPAFVDQGLQLSVCGESPGKADEAALNTGILLEARNHRNALIMTGSAVFDEHGLS